MQGMLDFSLGGLYAHAAPPGEKAKASFCVTSPSGKEQNPCLPLITSPTSYFLLWGNPCFVLRPNLQP
jgi:hypothetical protein